jgi:hypothetical protein
VAERARLHGHATHGKHLRALARRLPRAHRTEGAPVGPAQGDADSKPGPTRPLSAIGTPRATFHHGPEPSAPHHEAGDTTAVQPTRPTSGTTSSLSEKTRRKNQLVGGVQIRLASPRTLPRC